MVQTGLQRHIETLQRRFEALRPVRPTVPPDTYGIPADTAVRGAGVPLLTSDSFAVNATSTSPPVTEVYRTETLEHAVPMYTSDVGVSVKPGHDLAVEGDAALKQTVDGVTPVGKTVDVDTPVKQTVDGDTSVKQTVDIDTPVKQTGDGDTPVKQTVDGDTPVKQTVDVDTPVKQTVDGDTPVKQTVADDKPVKQTVESDTTVTQAVEGDTPVKQCRNKNIGSREQADRNKNRTPAVVDKKDGGVHMHHTK